jgi:glyoxylase-like metal-dependent hydrolase (beta-lactamase superfamily II)
MTAPLPPVLDHPFASPPPPGETLDAAPGVRWLRMPLPFALNHINLWLIDGDRECVLVDCGYGNAATRAIWETHFATTLARQPITRIVATHCHPDHVGNAAWLASRFGATVAMTSAEYLAAHAILDQHSGFGIPATIDLYRRHGMATDHVDALDRRGNHYRVGVPELPLTYFRLLDRDVLAAGGTTWRVIEGHGHSPEHASLYSAERGVLISGDMLLPRISTNVAVSPIEPDADPLGRFLASLAAFDALPPDTLVLPSHGLPFRGIALRTAQLRAHHAARLAEILAAVAKAPAHAVSAADVVPVLFTRDLDVHQRSFATGEAIAHLNHLWHAGRLARRIADDGSVRFARVAN